LVLLLADFGYVSYTTKQSVMILMILTVVPTSRYAFKHRRHSVENEAAPPSSPRPGPRRFVMRT